MRKIAVTALLCVAVAVGIGLLSSFHGQAQTPQQTWSTLLGDKQADLQPNRIRIEYEQPSSEELKPDLLGDAATPTLAKGSGDFQPAAIAS